MKVSDKLSKVNDSFNVYMYDNGFMVEIGGRDSNEEWATAKIMVHRVAELTAIVEEVAGMERDS